MFCDRPGRCRTDRKAPCPKLQKTFPPTIILEESGEESAGGACIYSKKVTGEKRARGGELSTENTQQEAAPKPEVQEKLWAGIQQDALKLRAEIVSERSFRSATYARGLCQDFQQKSNKRTRSAKAGMKKEVQCGLQLTRIRAALWHCEL